jgi:prepilin-type N-terminal cleavage/methylation domain-containing protein
MISIMETRRARATRPRGFTLVEVLIAITLSVVVLGAVLASNLQIIRGGVRMAHYVEMDAQVRRAFEVLGRDLKAASAVKWNGASDLTLTLPLSNGSTTQVTYAWTAASGAFFRVAGASSATLVGRLELVRGIPAQADGSAGLTFARFDRDGVAATTDITTKSIQVSMTIARNTRGVGARSTNMVSATYTLRAKPLS